MVGYAVAVDAAMGRERWRLRPEGPKEETLVPAPAVDGDTVYLGVSNQQEVALSACPLEGCAGTPEPWPDTDETGFVVALDAVTGTERWRVPTDGSASLSPIVADGTLVGPGNGDLLALDAGTGRKTWRWNATENDREGPPEWIDSAAVDRVLVCVIAGRLDADGSRRHTLDARTGAERWTVSRGGGMVYLADDGQDGLVVVVLDATSRGRRWRSTGAGIDGGWPALFLASGVLCPELAWDPQSLPEPLAAVANLVGVDGTAGVRTLDAAAGAEHWRYGQGSKGGVTIVVGNGAVYLLNGEDGTLTALIGAPEPPATRAAPAPARTVR
jgi:outer membrane protein assembly factor BamB